MTAIITAAVILLLPGGAAVTAEPEAAQAAATAITGTLLVAGADGVYRIDAARPRAATRVITQRGISYLALAPDGKRLYGTVRVQQQNRLGVWQKESDGSWQQPDTVAIPGRGACHLSVAPGGNFLYVANYTDGSVVELALNSGDLPQVKNFHRNPGNDAGTARAHWVGFSPDGRTLAVADLGLDRVFFHAFDPRRGRTVEPYDTLVLPAGSGPRHLAFAADDTLWIANERASTVAVATRDAGEGKWRIAAIATTRDPGATGKNYPAAIRVVAPRRAAVTNRGDDRVTIFEYDANLRKLRRVETHSAHGRRPQDWIVLPDGTPVTALENSDAVTCGAMRIDMPKPVAILWQKE